MLPTQKLGGKELTFTPVLRYVFYNDSSILAPVSFAIVSLLYPFDILLLLSPNRRLTWLLQGQTCSKILHYRLSTTGATIAKTNGLHRHKNLSRDYGM